LRDLLNNIARRDHAPTKAWALPLWIKLRGC
jgi:hypothetical protein